MKGMRVLGNIALCKFGPGIETNEGPTISFIGFRYPTRMTVTRLPNRDLLSLVHRAFGWIADVHIEHHAMQAHDRRALQSNCLDRIHEAE